MTNEKPTIYSIQNGVVKYSIFTVRAPKGWTRDPKIVCDIVDCFALADLDYQTNNDPWSHICRICYEEISNKLRRQNWWEEINLNQITFSYEQNKGSNEKI